MASTQSTSAAGAAPATSAAGAAGTTLAQQSGTFEIGGELPIYRLGFGTMRLTGEGIWGEPKDRAEAIRVLRRAVDLGVNFIDTADSYGPDVAEKLIAEALHPYPAGLVIATKGGFTRPGPGRWLENGRPDYLRAVCEKSLRQLRVERIDLYQLHRIDAKVPAADQIGTLKQLQEEGKIRFAGLSEVTVAQVEHARTIMPIVSVQNRYSLTETKSQDVLDYCEREDLGFIPWNPLEVGALAKGEGPIARIAARLDVSSVQVAIAWLLARSPVMLPIPGTSRVTHLDENMASAAVRLSERDLNELERA